MGFRLASYIVMSVVSAGLSGSIATCQNQSPPAGGGDANEAKPASSGAVTLQGVDTSALMPREKQEWSTYVNEFLAPCNNVPVSIAQCVQEKRACAKCLPAAKFILSGVRHGLTREQVEKIYQNRFSADKLKSVPVDGSPSLGAESAPVTLVEFADFECPHCGMVAPMLDKAYEANKDKMRLVYKFMPLSGHPHGEIAARAAIAAMNQGKFWEMHHKLFTNQQHLEQADLEKYAKEIALDVGKFKADMQAPATKERIEKDKKLADALNVQGTPTIYINGREFDPTQEIEDWVALELQMMGNEPTAAPGAAASSAPKADAGKK